MTDAAGEPASKIDCHVHSMYSPDGRGSLKELVAMARRNGLTGFCVADHNSVTMAQIIQKTRREFPGFLLVPGIEVSTDEGHCLALGVTTSIQRDLTLVETLAAIEAAGGVGVPSHPYRLIHGVGQAALETALPGLRAIETFNARDNRRGNNRRAKAFAEQHKLGGTGGSDAHQIFEIGNAYAAFGEYLGSVEDFLEALRRGRSVGLGRRTPRRQLLMQNVKNGFLYAKRGFRGI